MALSRELSRRLHSDDEPLAKRLKLAENAFVRQDLPVTRKKDLILGWLCEESERSKHSTPVWSSLSRCLRFESTAICLKSDVKRTLIQVLISKLSTVGDVNSKDVLGCCDTVFTCSETRRYFVFDIGALADLLAALFALVSRLCDATAVASARECAVRGVECFVACYKLAPNKESWCDVFVRQILYPLCSLVDSNRCDRLGAMIHKCAQHVIFAKSRHWQSNEPGESLDRGAERFFQELKDKAETCEAENSTTVFVCLFRAAFATYKNEPDVVDFVFRGLLNAAAAVKFRVLFAIRPQLTSVTFDYENKFGEKTLFEYLRGLLIEVIESEMLEAEHYRALETVAVLNPLVIEADVEKLLASILLKRRDEPEVMNSYRDLMIALVEAGIRLRREQKLVSWILKAIEGKLEEGCVQERVIDAVLPLEFSKRFSRSVSSMTSAQSIGVLRTLLFHLGNCVENCGKDETVSAFLLQANVTLLSAYFDGVRIFDNSVPISGQNKFIECLKELGKIVSSLAEKVVETDGNERMIAPMLTVVWYWDSMQDWMSYYSPDAVPQKLAFPISEEQMRGIIAKIDNTESKSAMNKILVKQICHNLDNGIAPNFTTLLDGFENSWSIILDRNPRLLSALDNSQITELAVFLLNDARSTPLDAAKSIRILNTDYVQNDERFVKAVAYGALVDIATRANESMTRSVTGHVNALKILKRGNASKVIKEMRNELAKQDWKSLNEKSLSVIQKNLEILLCLPLRYLTVDLRTVLLLVVHCVKKECDGNPTILTLCRDITMDASEKFDIDVTDLLGAASLMDELTRDDSFQRVVESSLRNVSSWETLKIFTKLGQTSERSATILLECVERVRPKLKGDDREIFKKAESKLCKKLLDTLDTESYSNESVKRLCLILKASVANGKIPENLVELTKSSLRRVFALGDEAKEENLIAEGLQLVGVVLRNRGKLEIDDETISCVWPHVLKNPNREVVLPLLERTEPKALGKVLASLHTKTITELRESNINSFRNSLILWDSIVSVQMGSARQKLRTTALHNLLQVLQISVIPVTFWTLVLKLVQTTLPESLHIVERSIDLVLLLAERALNEAGVSVCRDVLVVCSSLVKFNTSHVTDRLPVLLSLYRKIITLVTRDARKTGEDSYGERKLGAIALDIEKFTNILVKLKKDLARISPYVIADLVEIFSEGVIPMRIKGPLEDSVGHFLSIADQHAVSLLSRALPTSTRAIFQRLYETYNKFYKYTGKI